MFINKEFLQFVLAIKMGCIIPKQKQSEVQTRLDYLKAQTRRLENSLHTYQSQNNILQNAISLSEMQPSSEFQLKEINTLSQKKQEIRRLKQRQDQLNKQISLIQSLQSKFKDQIMSLGYKSRQFSSVQFSRLTCQIQQRQQELFQLNFQCYTLQQEKPKSKNKSVQQLNTQIENLQAEKRQLQLQIAQPMENQYLIVLAIQNKAPIQLTTKGSTTLRELKVIIHDKHYDQFIPQLMILLENNYELNVDQKIQHVFLNPIVNLKIRMAEAWELDELRTDKEKDGDITLQKGVAFTRCGHAFSRNCMRETIKNHIKQKKLPYFTCPYPSEGQNDPYGQVFLTHECQMIGGYTKDEWAPISAHLSQIYIRQNTKQCPNPKCRKSIYPLGITTKKVQCPVCRTTQFCKACGDIWKWKGNAQCFSQTCHGINQIIAKTPRNRKFPVSKKGTSIKITVDAPNTRACPKCKCLVMNIQQCKHTKCMCGIQFCFICLSVKNPNWSCGGAYQQCPLAPNQVFGSKN